MTPQTAAALRALVSDLRTYAAAERATGCGCGQCAQCAVLAQSPDDFADRIAAVLTQEGAPIPMILHCPECHTRHIDAVEPRFADNGEDDTTWTNPPHRSHLCHHCGCIWRPADVLTTGVESIETRGKADTWPDAPAEPRAASTTNSQPISNSLTVAEPRAAEGAGNTWCVQCNGSGEVQDTDGIMWKCAWCASPTAAAAVPAGGDAVAWDGRRSIDNPCAAELLASAEFLRGLVTGGDSMSAGLAFAAEYLYLFASKLTRGGVTEATEAQLWAAVEELGWCEEDREAARKNPHDEFMEMRVIYSAMVGALAPAAQAQDAGPK